MTSDRTRVTLHTSGRGRRIWLVALTIVGPFIAFAIIVALSIVPISSETPRAKVVSVLAARFDAEVDLRSLHLHALPLLRTEGRACNCQ